MKPRVVVIILAVVLVIYFALIGNKAVIAADGGGVVGWGLAAAAVLLPIVGAVLLFFELRFGWRTQQLGRELGADGGLPEVADLPMRPSGRVEKTAALAHFEVVKAETENAPEDWRSFFRLADAYDLAGDRKRAREAMRKAIAMHG